MKKAIITLLFLCLSFSTFARKTEVIPCKLPVCVESGNFYAEVKKISKRGDFAIFQLEYRYKDTRSGGVYIGGASLNIKFNETPKGSVTVIDAKGNEFTIDGEDIGNFKLTPSKSKIFSFKLKGNEDKKITEPFDLTIKASSPHGEIAFFDLSSKLFSK